MEQPSSRSSVPLRRGWSPLVGTALFVLPSTGFVAHAVYAFSLYQSEGCTRIEECPEGLKLLGSAWAELAAAASVLLGVAALSLLSAGRMICALMPHLQRAWGALVSRRGAGGGLLWRGAPKRHPHDPDAKRVRCELEKQRLQFARAFLAKAVLPLLIGLLHFAFKEADRDYLQRGPRVAAWGILFASAVVPLLVVAAIAVVADVKPSVVTPRFLDRCDILLSALWVWVGTVRTPNSWYSADLVMRGFFRCLFAIAVGNFRQTTLTNTLVFAVNALNLRTREGMWNTWFLLEVCITATIYAACWVWREYQLGQARDTVMAQKKQHGAVLLGQMMEVICDAVPRLDADLQLLEPCPRLSSLLLRDGSISQGARFADLVVHEDLDRLLACLGNPLKPTGSGAVACGQGASGTQGSADSSGPFAGLCRARLRTANGRQLPVLVYYSCVPNLDGRAEFLLGLCEDSQEDTLAPRADVEPGTGLAALPEQHAALEDDVRSNVSWSAASSDGEEGAEQHSLVVDLDSGNLRVLWSCWSFALLGGTKGACDGLAEWMCCADTDRLRQHCRHTGRGELTVLLKPTAGGGSYRCKVARAPRSSSFVTVEPETEAPASNPVCLILYTTEFSPAQKKGGKRMLDAMMDKLWENNGPLTACLDGQAAQRCADDQAELFAEVHVRFHDRGSVLVTKVSRSSPAIKELFEAVPELHLMLEDPSGFINAVSTAVAKLPRGGAPRAGRLEVGRFACKEPSSLDVPARLAVDVRLLSLSWKVELEAKVGLIFVRLPPTRAARAEAEHAEPSTDRSAQPPPCPPPEPCPSLIGRGAAARESL